MNARRWTKTLLFLGDILLLYGTLWLTLTIRYGSAERGLWKLHLIPFSIIFAILLLTFFIAGLYDVRVIAPERRHATLFFLTLLVGGGVAVLLFYLVPAWRITPRLNLFTHLALASLFLFLWHWLISWLLMRRAKINVWFLANPRANPDREQSAKQRDVEIGVGVKGGEHHELVAFLASHPQLGYQIAETSQKADIVVTSSDLYQNEAAQKELFLLVPRVRFMSFSAFYERVTGKVPVSLISEIWFLENIAETEKEFFEIIKRIFDVVLAIFISIPGIFLFPLLALLIKGETRGPVFIKQNRVGKNGRLFTLLKLRSMIVAGPHGLAEENGAQWASAHDKRITRVGRILRKTRLDELPQLWNILKGEMSFVGPRPERPEFVATLKKRIPFYEIRHMARPGLSGWAQINFPYGASVEDALEKLRYDLYYLKHRSFLLDLTIALKTLKVLVLQAGR